MTVRLTRKRIDLIRSALCTLQVEHDGEEQPPEDFSSRDEFDKEMEACFEWLRQTERKRNKQKQRVAKTKEA